MWCLFKQQGPLIPPYRTTGTDWTAWHTRAASLHACRSHTCTQARDISRLSYNTTFFQPDVTFSDGFRSFKGRDKYKQDSWPRAALKQPKGVSRVGCVCSTVQHSSSPRG